MSSKANTSPEDVRQETTAEESILNEEHAEQTAEETVSENTEADSAAEAEAVETEESDTETADADDEQEVIEEEDDSAAGLDRKSRKLLEKKEAELQAMKERYMRTLAEYENFRKRSEREKADLYGYAVKDTMLKMLPVLDNLERGIQALPEEAKDDPVAEGMTKIFRQFEKAVEDVGVKPMNAEGTQFDPNLHQAIMHTDDPELGKNVVAKELMKGYTYKELVVRTAMVSVAN